MKRFLEWRALSRAGLLTAASLLAVPALAGPTSKPALRGSLAPATQGSVQPQAGPALKFFTISQRVAALRASGSLPDASTSDNETTLPVIQASLMIEPPQPSEKPAARPMDNLLGMAVLPVPGGELAEKWQGMAARWEGDKAIIEACQIGTCTHRGAAKWLSILDEAEQRSGRAQLSYVHASINRSIRYASDFVNNGEADYWASPLESIEKLGDCEDYAIAKYMMMRTLGYSTADLKLVVLFQQTSGLYHAILAVRAEGKWLYMDNQRNEIAVESDYRAIRPIAALDENGQSMLAQMPKVFAFAAGIAPSARGPR